METTTGRLEPRLAGYADVNGVHMYYEVYGDGSPLVLLHGGMLTIDLNFAALIPALARAHQALLVSGDRDFTTVEHGALMQQLIPGSQLAILPGTTHMQVTRRADLLLPMLARFLD